MNYLVVWFILTSSQSLSSCEATKIMWKTAATQITNSAFILSLWARISTGRIFHFSAILDLSNITNVPSQSIPKYAANHSGHLLVCLRDVPIFPVVVPTDWPVWRNSGKIGVRFCLFTSRIPRAQVTNTADAVDTRGEANRPMTRDVRRTIGKRTKSWGFGKIPNGGER